MKLLRKISVLIALAALLATSACNTTHDCRGRVKHKLPNGVWI